MELVNVAVARAIAILDLAELNNRGLRVYPDLLDSIRKKYDFDKEADPAKLENRYKLFNGFYSTNHGKVTVGLQLYSDGVWAETNTNTTDSEAFLNDLLNWSKTELGMNYSPGMIKSKGYQSELVIRSNIVLTTVCDGLSKFAKRLASVPFNGRAKRQELVTVSFGADGDPSANFTFDRRTGAPFAENKFYCRAPLPTDEHFRLLQEFEALFLEPATGRAVNIEHEE